ncbi:hypothetical protein TWF106_004981 [Orbilia oligospora]|uniref:Uncharacterized protein n=1 Tax=Orbilia oligospora TaxID=2813651 RepID=A0A7C8Q642_ORBOL|nr:hypothetical protein TWF106_004981 [Orbilia oligospora]
MSESNINSSNDNSKAKANANANGGSSHPQGVGKGKSDDEHKESWMTLQVDKGREWFKQLKAELKKDRLWQHILKCSIATECALIICLIPAVALGYGPAVFLGAIVSVFGHPGRNLGAMLETIVFALVGALVGTGWVTFASYVSDLIYRNNAENAHAFRAIILVVSLLVHGYLRSKIPKIFVGVLLFLLTVIIQMTTPNFQFSAKVATTFLYPEAEVADEEFLKHLIERVDEPLTTIRATLQQSITALIACIEFSCDVPITPENQSRKPKGILLKEIDIYANAIEVALVEFDKKTREALHKAAEEASEEEEVEFDILPREEIFLVSSFLLNFRIAAQTTLDMLKEGRDMVEEYDGLKGKKNFHLPDFKSKKWLFSGSAEQSETLDTNARENVSRYQKTAGAGNADQKAATQQKKDGSRTDSKKGSLKKTDKKTDKKTEGGKSKGGKGEKPEAQKSERKGSKEEEEEEEEPESWPTRLRGALADVVDWVVTSPHLHYALKLAIGAMLLSWPAFVPEFSNFFYTYRGLWVIVIYILVFENSVGTSVQVFAYRTVGTITGSLWGYAAWSAGRGNPYVIAVMLYFGFLVAFYIQLNTRYVKAGMVLTISMVVVSVGTSIDYIPGTVRGTALENFLKRAVAMIIGGSGALIVQTVIFPVKARVKLVETIGLAVLKINEMESAIAFGVDQTTNIGDLANENAVKAFYKARKKADVSLAAASAYLTVSTQEPRIKGSFSIDKMIYKEIIYVLHQIIDRMENVLQLRLQLGSAVLENYYVYVYKYRRNVAAAITITLYAVHEALTSKLPLPQYFPSARLAQLRMVNRVRQILMESVSTNNNNNENITESQEAEDTAKRILRVEFMSYNASSAALEQVIEWLEELVDLTKLLRGAAEFRVGLLSRPTYREWVRQISIGGGGIGGAPPPSSLPPLSLSSVGEKPEPTKEEEPEQQQQQQQQQHGEGNHHRLAKIISSTRKQDVDTEAGEAGDGIPEPLKRVQSRHRENRAGVRRLSQSGGLPERVDALRRAARGL